MAYVKGMLFGTAAILAVLFVPTLMRFFWRTRKGNRTCIREGRLSGSIALAFILD
jgi:hypothetical protein